MGYIKEPAGVDLNVEPMPFSVEDRKEVSAIIAQYKSTGEMPKLPQKSKSRRKSIAGKDGKLAQAKPKAAKEK